MTPEQKQQAKQLIADWTNVSKTSTPAVWFLNGDCMAGFLQELVDAPTPEPFGYFKAEPFGWTDCAETDDGAIALFAAPPAPSVPDGWRSAIAKEFPLYDEDEIDEDKHCCEWVMLQERKRLHKILAAPTPAPSVLDGWKNAAEWLRNNYQDYPNISSLCEAMVAQSANNGSN